MAKTKGVPRILNPPFDPRTRTIGPPGHHKGMKRGHITLARPHPATGVKHAIRFMYNPISVQVDHGVSTPIINDPNMQQKRNMGQMGNLVGIGRTNVQLYFDRTYETWDRSKRGTRAGRFGVYADVLAFYQMLNIAPIERDTDIERTSWGLKITETMWHNLYPVSPPTYTLAYLYIGDKLKFYGQIESLNVTYSHFTQKMVPNRGVVSLSLALLSDSSTKKARGKTSKTTRIKNKDINGVAPGRGGRSPGINIPR